MCRGHVRRFALASSDDACRCGNLDYRQQVSKPGFRDCCLDDAGFEASRNQDLKLVRRRSPMSQPTVVILGASSDRSKFGNKSVRAHVQAGYQVFPVNPRAGQIEGLTAYATLSELPVRRVDRVSLYLPPAVGITVVAEIAALAPQEVWLNPGTADDALLAAAERSGLHVIEGCSIVDLGLSPSQFPG
jgi:uncharacterized protein